MAQGDSEKLALPSLRDVRAQWNADRTEANLARTRERLRRRTRRIKIATGLGTALILLLGIVFARRRWSADAFVAKVGPSVSSEYRRTVQFQDGSSVELLDARSHLEMGPASDDRIEVTLRGGSGQFEVASRPQRRFIVHAADIDVIVVGTSFRVTQVEPRVHVAVDRGRVEVRFPGGTRFLSAGEASWFPPSEPSANAPAATSPESAAAENAPAPSSSAGGDLRTAQRRFTDHVSKGNYVDAFAVLERWPQVAGSSPGELMLAADAARLSNHPAQAVIFLDRITREYPRDSRAPLAGFTLGRILMSQLGRPAEAAEAFALTRRLSPRGPLAEDALAREAESAELAGARDDARALAEEYMRTYPNGRRLHSVQQRGAAE